MSSFGAIISFLPAWLVSNSIISTKYLSKRCFDKALVYIDMTLPKDEEVFNLMFHQIEFFNHVFDDNFVESVGVYFVNSTEVPDKMINHMKVILNRGNHVSFLFFNLQCCIHTHEYSINIYQS